MMKTKRFFMLTICISTLTLITFRSIFAQVYEKKIFEYVRLISEGKSELVQTKIDDLKNKIPRSAGVIYIEGLIASDDKKSLSCFKVIVDSFPRSEWADDALARLFEYYLSTGRASDAEKSFQLFQNQYPNSPYITTGYLRQQRLSQESLTYNRTIPRSQGQEWAIQIGAFSIKENAEKLRKKFISDGYTVNVYENLLDGKNLLYLVWVGSFDTEDEARPLLKEIKSKYNIDGVLRMRQVWKKW